MDTEAKHAIELYDPDKTTLVSSVDQPGLKNARYLINGYPGVELELELSRDETLYLIGKDILLPIEKYICFSSDCFFNLLKNHGRYPVIPIAATYLLNKAKYGTVPTPKLLLTEFTGTASRYEAIFLVDKTANKTMRLRYDRRSNSYDIRHDSLDISFPGTYALGDKAWSAIHRFCKTADPQFEFFKWSAGLSENLVKGMGNVNF